MSPRTNFHKKDARNFLIVLGLVVGWLLFVIIMGAFAFNDEEVRREHFMKLCVREMIVRNCDILWQHKTGR